MMIHIFNMKTGMITLCLAMTLVACRRSRITETVETINVAIDSTTADSTAEERTLANDGKASDIEGIADKDVIDGWILTCPWTKWENEQGSFVVQYPAFLKENHEQMCNHYDCLVAEWKRLRFIAKRNRDSMSLEEKYEELKGGAVTSSIGYDSFLLAGKMYDDMRFFEKEIKGEHHWYYLRVEFPVELTAAIDPLLQYVKEYKLAEFIRR